MTSQTSRIGADVGGTFTDVIALDTDGTARISKVLSTPPDYDTAVVQAVTALSAGGVAGVVHGTTVATNAVLERRGAKTALVTTAGFRDVLELRRLRIPHMYDPFWRKPDPLVPRRHRFELGERITAQGEVLAPVRDDEVRLLAAELRAAGVDSVAVCLLHSYRFPGHEDVVGKILREELPNVEVSLSSEILREQREYERTATTVEIRALRLASIGPTPAGDWFRLPESRAVAGGSRIVRFDGVARETPLRSRAAIGARAEPGPVMVDEYDTTVVVRSGWTVRRDPATDTLVLERP